MLITLDARPALVIFLVIIIVHKMDYWIDGFVDRWNIGLMDFWNIGLVE